MIIIRITGIYDLAHYVGVSNFYKRYLATIFVINGLRLLSELALAGVM